MKRVVGVVLLGALLALGGCELFRFPVEKTIPAGLAEVRR